MSNYWTSVTARPVSFGGDVKFMHGTLVMSTATGVKQLPYIDRVFGGMASIQSTTGAVGSWTAIFTSNVVNISSNVTSATSFNITAFGF